MCNYSKHLAPGLADEGEATAPTPPPAIEPIELQVAPRSALTQDNHARAGIKILPRYMQKHNWILALFFGMLFPKEQGVFMLRTLQSVSCTQLIPAFGFSEHLF